MTGYTPIALPEPEQARSRKSAAVAAIGALALVLVAFNPTTRSTIRSVMNSADQPQPSAAPEIVPDYEDRDWIAWQDCQYGTGTLIPLYKDPMSYCSIYGGPGVELPKDGCTMEKYGPKPEVCKPNCKNVMHCHADCQCSTEDEMCNREMVRPTDQAGLCTECEVMSMAECLLHPCECSLVDLIDRCVKGEAADACAAFKANGCEERDCDHHEFLKSGGQGFHYLGGSNVIDEGWEDRTTDLTGANSGGSGGGKFAQASTDQGGAGDEDAAAEAHAAMEAAQAAQILAGNGDSASGENESGVEGR